ncbi:hypothetical protein GSB9_03325 [Flavobacteriaceae bacterium GSB9]|nr:hypothetical protein GSB9_03325 [Flavobacteriaceae bacterium GSB9]
MDTLLVQSGEKIYNTQMKWREIQVFFNIKVAFDDLKEPLKPMECFGNTAID